MCLRTVMKISAQNQNDSECDDIIIDLVHERQKYNWDCGVACVLMVLEKEARAHLTENLGAICREEGFGRSTWTIDLCYLLNRYDVSHEYSTITIGIHTGYHEHSFYNSILEKDTERVLTRFDQAEQFGLKIHCRREPLDRILQHLDTGKPVIVLTNARLLRCDQCKIIRLGKEIRRCLRISTSYQGHYIVLCGHNRKQGRIYYRNPSLHDHICRMSYNTLDEARSSYGTDEDIIFIT